MARQTEDPVAQMRRVMEEMDRAQAQYGDFDADAWAESGGTMPKGWDD